MTKPLHVLHAVPDMNAGGLENFIMNIFRNIDGEQIRFDFLMHHSYGSFFDEEIRSLGGAIYRYPVVENKNLVEYFHFVKALLQKHPEISIVHSHMCSTGYFTLGAARKAGCAVRISHSHSTSHDRSVKGYIKWALSRFAPLNATELLACSTEAGKYLFGNRSFSLQHNAINTDRFAFDSTKRGALRARLNINDSLVIGHVGRFTEAKNHQFIIRVFAKVKKQRPDAKLLLVGDGEPHIIESVNKLSTHLNLADSVIFAGACSNPEDYYSAFDVFLFPSLFEGLPLTGVEAQCSGLPCIFSNAITPELCISDYAHYLSLDAGEETWARALVDAAESKTDRSAGIIQVRDAGYDAATEAEKLFKWYVERARR